MFNPLRMAGGAIAGSKPISSGDRFCSMLDQGLTDLGSDSSTGSDSNLR
nr:hypothetical protein [Trichocoleus desertorum]